MADQKIKVRVADLIVKIEKFKTELLAEEAKVQKEFDAKLDKYKKEVIDALTKALASAKKGDLPDTYGYGNHHAVKVYVEGNKPENRKANVAAIDADLALLRLSADETIQVAHDTRWGAYLKGTK